MNALRTAILGITLLFVTLLSFCQPNALDPLKYSSLKNMRCKNGAVVSAHRLASVAGVMMLEQGGNAVDAVIATQLALAVVYPSAGNIGGGGFFVARLKNGKNITIDYREMAPGNASRDMYLDVNGNAQTKLSIDGHLASGVPGTIAGLFACLKYAKLPFKTLIGPAIQLAENGFAISASQANAFNDLKDEFIKLNTSIPVFVKNDAWKEGNILVQKDLAATLKRIRDKGLKGFYEGETARLIVEEMKKGNGIITEKDLKNYTVKTRTPIVFNYKGYEILTMPPTSSGGIILEQMLKMVEKRNIASMKFLSTESVQLMTEVERRAFADRSKFLGDPDFVNIPYKALVSDKYLDDRMRSYSPDKASLSVDIEPGTVPPEESQETTHISVIDKDGNAVSVTTTLNNSYGSRTVVTGAGFIMNDEMDDFSVKPGVPNMYGAIGGEANSIVPGKRMLSSMTPTIVLKNKQPYLVVGTPGGTTIPTSVFQTIVDILDFGLSADDAVNKPKFHHQWLPDSVFVEKAFPQNVRTALEKMGYKVRERGAIGRTEVIKVYGKNDFEAVADKRGDDSSAGY